MNGNNLFAFAIVLALDIGLLSQGAKTKGLAYFTKVEIFNQWPELIDISCELNKTVQNQTALYARFKLEEDISHANGVFILKFKHGNRMLNYTAFDLDFCEAFQMVHKQYLIRMIFVGLRRVSNIPLSCPFKKNVDYYINGFSIDSKMIPSYLPRVAFVAELNVLSLGQKLVYAKLYGQRE